MANGIRTGDPRGFNKGPSSKFREGTRVQQTPEEGRCGNNNKDEDNSPKTLNDKKDLNNRVYLLFISCIQIQDRIKIYNSKSDLLTL